MGHWRGRQVLNSNQRSAFFYNDFNNLISYGIDPSDPRVSMTINIDKFKTTGVHAGKRLFGWKDLQATVGFSYIGRYNNLLTTQATR
jgi:outer membrane receptor for ferrienterochelin and colicins